MYRTLPRAFHAFGLCLLAGLLTAQPGTLDPTFNPGGSGADSTVLEVVLQPDGKILIGGVFTHYNGVPAQYIARLMPDGTLDTTFQTGAYPYVAVDDILVQPDGRILWAGIMSGLGRLHADGSVDTSFTPFHNRTDAGMALQPDGKVILAGGPGLATHCGPQHQYITRLLSNGAADPDWSIPYFCDCTVPKFAGSLYDIVLRPDGKILVAGVFGSVYFNQCRDDLALLISDGTLDPTIIPHPGPYLKSATGLTDNSTLIGCEVSYPSPNAVRKIRPDGTYDPAFSIGSGANGTVRSIAITPDGGSVIFGQFNLFDGMIRNNVARLGPNGDLDLSFDVGSGPAPGGSGTQKKVAVDLAGNTLVAGEFTSFDGTPAGRIVRLLDCQVGAPCDDGDPNTLVDVLGADCLCNGVPRYPSRLFLKVLLNGPRIAGQTGIMHQLLRQYNMLPLQEPYTALPGFTHVGHGGGETTTLSVFSGGSGNNIVDWVFLELRDPDDSTQVLQTRSALLTNDGRVVDVDGHSPVEFEVGVYGPYFVAVRHRNHLGVMTAQPVLISPSAAPLDLTDGSVPLWGTAPQVQVNGLWHLWAGDANGDGTIKYTGSNNDRDIILQAIGGVVPTNVVLGYFGADVTMNRLVQYTGASNDRDVVLQNVGGTVPTSTRVEQLP